MNLCHLRLHYAGAHVAAAFLASTLTEDGKDQEVVSVEFTPERVLQRARSPMVPMPDGRLVVDI